jgi:hypothetical protein
MNFPIYPIGHLVIAIAEIFLITWSIRLWIKYQNIAMIVLSIVAIGVCYDNLILASGSSIGVGSLLQSLNEIRFLIHHLSVPLLIVVGVDLARRTQADWANRIPLNLAWILSLILGIIDVLNRYIGADLKPIYFAGVLRYTMIPTRGAPIIVILVTLFVLLIGLGIWIGSKGKWFWLFFGTLIALIGNGVPSSLVGTLPGSFAEFLMISTLVLTVEYVQKTLITTPN